MKFRFSLYIALAVAVGGLIIYSRSRPKRVEAFPELNHYESQAGDLFYFRLADGEFVLLERRKALAVAVSPRQNLIAYSYPEKLTLSRKGGDMWENQIFSETKGQFHSLAFSPDEKILAAGSPDNPVTIWDVAGRKVSIQLEQAGPVLSLAYSPDGEVLAIGLDQHAGPVRDTVVLLNAANYKLLNSFGTQPAEAIAFSPDGKMLAVGFSDGSILIGDKGFQKPARALQASSSAVVALDFHPGGISLASGQADKKINLWTLETGQLVHTFEPKSPANPLFPRGVEKISFDPSGSRLGASYSDGELRVWSCSPPKN